MYLYFIINLYHSQVCVISTIGPDDYFLEEYLQRTKVNSLDVNVLKV